MSEPQDVKTQVSGLVAAVKTLALAWKDKTLLQVKPKARSAGIIGGSLGAAGYLALNAVSLLFLAGGAGFGALYSRWMNPWGATALGLVTMAVVLLIVVAVLALLAKAQIPELTKPLDVADDVKAGAEVVKAGIEKGKAEVEGAQLPELEDVQTAQ